MELKLNFSRLSKDGDERKEEESYTYNTTTTCIAEEE